MRRHKSHAVAGVGLLILAGPVLAAGYQFSELSAAGLASAGAVVADPVTVGAVPYNPAMMAFHGGQHLMVDGVLADSRIQVQGASGGSQASQVAMPRLVPDIDYFATGLHWSAGIGLDSPYGFEVDWPLGTFGTAGTAQPLASKLTVYDLHPTVGYRRGNFAVALAMDYINVRELLLTTPAGSVQGSGNRPGYSVGLAYQHRAWTAGARYRSAVSVDTTDSAAGLPATTALQFPWSFQIGLRRQISRRWALETDFERTGWNRFQSWTTLGPGGSVLNQQILDWSAANTYRVGATYDVGRGVHVHFGLAVDRTGASSRWASAPPDPNRRVYSMGATQDLGPWELDAGLAYAQFATTTVASAIPVGSYGGELNGTSAFNGTYHQHTILLAVGVTRRF